MYLIAGPRTMAGELSSPPQTLFTNWLIAEGIDRTRGNRLTVWDDLSAVFDVFELDENGDPVDPPTTSPEALTVSTLPPVSGETA
ncbi:hypothetical protein ABT340_39550 [Streptosporangium sp. NPDC000239]|uniref:hypothetical protein n=1 Tax=Streptosporangium sp. NPDC000239 TaxID=3154248 RepID=UPI00332EFE42